MREKIFEDTKRMISVIKVKLSSFWFQTSATSVKEKEHIDRRRDIKLLQLRERKKCISAG